MIDVDVNEQFLYVVQPTYLDENSDQGWEGKINQVKKVISKRSSELQRNFNEFRFDLMERMTHFGQDLNDKYRVEHSQLLEILH